MTYTRGSAIPLVLILRGEDKQALDLLANPEAPTVRMRRKMNAPVGVNDEATGCSQPGAEGYRPISKAGWWHTEEFIDESDSTKRTLCGELTIPPHLTPSFSFGVFELWVCTMSSHDNHVELKRHNPSLVCCRYASIQNCRLCIHNFRATLPH